MTPKARRRWRRERFPAEHLPKFTTPTEFWTRIIADAHRGMVSPKDLVHWVMRQFPHNPEFRALAEQLGGEGFEKASAIVAGQNVVSRVSYAVDVLARRQRRRVLGWMVAVGCVGLVATGVGFWIAQTEVTQAQWYLVMGTNPRDSPEGGRWSWARGCDGIRLPTESEWEYAARAGTVTAYSFGDVAKDLCGYGNFADVSAAADAGEFDAGEGGTVSMATNATNVCDDGHPKLAPVESYNHDFRACMTCTVT